VTGRPAVLLLSGGLDSATAGAIARTGGYAVQALTVRYGQRHGAEVEAARRVGSALGVTRHLFVDVDLRAIGGSALTTDLPLPLDAPDPSFGGGSSAGGAIPSTYVPARNTVLLSLALAHAEAIGAFDIFIGANAVDYSGYPDCRPAFLGAFEKLADLATRAGVEGAGRFRVHAPLLELRKHEIIRRGLELGVDYAMTVSCYDAAADGGGCGRCDACRIRLRGFRELGVPDPARYRADAPV
jgi:7-cyano-7-deazaguanine synthase